MGKSTHWVRSNIQKEWRSKGRNVKPEHHRYRKHDFKKYYMFCMESQKRKKGRKEKKKKTRKKHYIK